MRLICYLQIDEAAIEGGEWKDRKKEEKAMWDKTWQGAFDKVEMVDIIATMLANGHSTAQIMQIQH
eukprot:1138345-Rhodomonas_salina.1